MNIQPDEPWRELARLASTEQDPDKLLWLMLEINRLLEENETQLAELRRDHAHA